MDGRAAAKGGEGRGEVDIFLWRRILRVFLDVRGWTTGFCVGGVVKVAVT